MDLRPETFDLQLRRVPLPDHADGVPLLDTSAQTICFADGAASCNPSITPSCYDTCCAAGSRLC